MEGWLEKCIQLVRCAIIVAARQEFSSGRLRESDPKCLACTSSSLVAVFAAAPRLDIELHQGRGIPFMFDQLRNELARLEAADVQLETDQRDALQGDTLVRITIGERSCTVRVDGFLTMLQSLPDGAGEP